MRQHSKHAAGVPAMAYVHIPLPEFMAVWNSGVTFGRKQERVCCAVQSGCLFDGLKTAGVTAVYSGHDHANSFYGTHQGVRLGYGLKTGYSSYGPPAGWQRGARVVLLREGQAPGGSETWLRLEDGSRHTQRPSRPGWLSRQYICSK